MKTAVEQVESLWYKLRMFGVPLEGPTNVFCDNEAVFKNASISDSTYLHMLPPLQGGGCQLHSTGS